MSKPHRFLAALLLALALPTATAAPTATEPLPALNVDITQSSISGISSGGFMSVQFQVAHSEIIRGAGVIAAGPYYCAQGSAMRATTQCSCTLDPTREVCAVGPESTDIAALVDATKRFAADKLIDDPNAMQRHRVFMVSGGRDKTVPADVVQQLDAFYRRFIPPKNIVRKELADAGHALPTASFGSACAVTGSPYINNCGVDAAGEILSWIYGPLKPRQDKLSGRLIRFDQTPFVPANKFRWLTGIDDTGWAYVPAACARGEACRVHVALHGCKQGQSYLPLKPPPDGGLYYGTIFVRHSGYNEAADANHIIVLYPQVDSIPGLNPNGCWDWWGYTDSHYADRRGVQISTIRAMLDKLSSGRR